MEFDFQERLAESPLVEKIWWTRTQQAGSFVSTAESHWEIVVATVKGQTDITIRGPETIATSADVPAEGEFLGIVFKLGAFMPDLPTSHRLDRNDLPLPLAAHQSFWLNGSTWEIPNLENADTFVDRLIREGLLVIDPVVEATLQGHPQDLSLRSIQNHFVRATGLTHNTIQQIDRAKTAMTLLRQGMPILDTVFEVGYYDQPHLTRSLKRFVGQTPAQIAQAIWPE